MSQDDDRALRERFEALRREEAASAPDFEDTLARARRGSPPAAADGWRLRWLWIPALTAAALALVLWRTPAELPAMTPGSDAPLAPWGSTETAAWSMPTDVLLETPGIELLRDAPAIGDEDSALPAPLRTSATGRIIG